MSRQERAGLAPTGSGAGNYPKDATPRERDRGTALDILNRGFSIDTHTYSKPATSAIGCHLCLYGEGWQGSGRVGRRNALGWQQALCTRFKSRGQLFPKHTAVSVTTYSERLFEWQRKML